MNNKPKVMKISLVDDEYEVEETTRRAAAPRIVGTHTVQAFAPNTAEAKESLVSLPQKQTLVALSRPLVWNLERVPQLPEYHPLEATAVFVDYASPSDISKRVSDVLRARSIEASYEDSKAKVKCLSPDGVDFRIRLYRGRKTYSTGIIVEVQRRFGTSPTFHQDTMAILDAVQSKSSSPPPPSFGASSIPLVSDSEDDYEVDGESSLGFVAKLLDAGLDSQYLAFQTLCSLTDASKMGHKTSHAVSCKLLQSENAVGRKVLDHVVAESTEDIYHLRTMAMTVLANVVVAVKGDIHSMIHEQIRPVLLRELSRADQNARMAQLSCLVVEQILKKDHDAAEFHVPLEKACEAGMSRHAGLEQQAKRCLELMPVL